MLRIDHCDLSEHAGRGAEWDALVAAMPRPSFFLSHDWVFAWARHFRGENEAPLFRAWDGNRLVGLLPLVKTRTCVEDGLLPATILSPCGALDLDGDHLDIICTAEDQAQVMTAIFGYLKQAYDGWDILHFPFLAEDAALVTHLPRLQTMFRPHLRWCSAARYLPITGGYENVLARLSGRRRRELGRLKRRFFDDHGGRFHQLRADEAIQGLDRLFELHELQSAGSGRRSKFSGERMLRFHRDLCGCNQAADRIRLSALEVDGETIALNYVFRFCGRYFGYQQAMDPAWRKHSPGELLIAQVVEMAFGDDVREFDFLRGEGGHKVRWTPSVRKLYNLNLANTGLAATLVCSTFPVRRFLGRIKHRLRSS